MMKKYELLTFAFMATLIMLALPVHALGDFDSVNLDASIYSYTPAPVTAGDSFELWIQLTNNSNTTATDVTYQLNPEYPFSVADFNNSEKTILAIAPYQTATIKYTINTASDAVDGVHELEFKYKKAGISSYNISKYNIDISGGNAIVDVIGSDLGKTTIGAESQIKLTIKNLGQKKAKDIFVTLSDSSDGIAKVINLKTLFVESLAPNEEKELSYKAIVSKTATNKSYTLPISITYSDADGNYTTSRSIGLEIEDNPNMIISVLSVGADKSGKLKASSDEKIELEIYNTGNIDAESVYVEANSEISNSFNKYFIGSIEKDNYDSVTLEFKTKAIKNENYPLLITVHYKDNNLKEQIKTETITVNVDSTLGQNGSPTKVFSFIIQIILFIVGIAVLIIVVKFLYKKIIGPAYRDVIGLFSKKKK